MWENDIQNPSLTEQDVGKLQAGYRELLDDQISEISESSLKEAAHVERKITIPCLEERDYGLRADVGFPRQIYHEGGAGKVSMNEKSLG